jgi:hypothetical protein
MTAFLPAAPVGPPEPPPGPGVQPPFVAAPIEGRRARIGLLLGIAGGLLAACCVVGGVALGGLLVLSQQAANEQAQAAVEDYLAALMAQDWQGAYEQVCAADRLAESPDQFASRWSGEPAIQSYQVGDPRRDQREQGDDPFTSVLTVPVDVVYASGTGGALNVRVVQNPNTGQFQVCETSAG